jgi:hypothetical protein
MHRFFKYDKKIIGEEVLFSSEPEFDFSCSIFFIKEDYYVSITVSYFDPFREIKKKYPRYFKYRADDTYLWKDEDKTIKNDHTR